MKLTHEHIKPSVVNFLEKQSLHCSQFLTNVCVSVNQMGWSEHERGRGGGVGGGEGGEDTQGKQDGGSMKGYWRGKYWIIIDYWCDVTILFLLSNI